MASAAAPGLRTPLGLSALLHGAVLAALFVTSHTMASPALPPVYKVNIVAAPPGPRAIGEVSPTPRPAEARPQPVREVVPTEAVAPVRSRTAPVKAPARATPTPPSATAKPSAQPLPKAGGGPTGGKGADVATVQTSGIDFPFPGYLNNIVRQIALRFKAPDANAPVRADVKFLIHRDGSVSHVSFVTRSGVYAFDLEAQGAVESAATAKAFGPLPAGFPDDVLPVVFSFDPRLLR